MRRLNFGVFFFVKDDPQLFVQNTEGQLHLGADPFVAVVDADRGKELLVQFGLQADLRAGLEFFLHGKQRDIGNAEMVHDAFLDGLNALQFHGRIQ